MVQEFHVVRCFSCQTFQTQQVKKVNKFVCKLCGSKQSVRKEYGRGNGKDCRMHVQKLNVLRGEIEVKEDENLESKLEEDCDLHDEYYDQEYDGSEQYDCLENNGDNQQYENVQNHESSIYKENSLAINEGKKSKWTSYLSNETVDDEEDEFTEIHEISKQQEGQELSGNNQYTVDNSGQRNRILSTNKYKKVKRDECHPYQNSTVRLTKKSYDVNSAENNQDVFLTKHKESFTKISRNSSSMKLSNEQNDIACPSIQFKKSSAGSSVTSSIANVSANKIGSNFTTANNIKYKEISTPSDGSVLVERKSSLQIKRNFKPPFIAKVKGKQNVYDKFADAHELEDIF